MATRRQHTEPSRRLPVGIIIIAFLFVGGLGYLAGAFHSQVFASIGSAFGLKTYSGTLDLSSVQTTYQTLRANYDGKIDEQALIEGANRGLVEAVGDDYTVYMNTKESEAFDDSLTGNIGGGIGIEVGERSDRLSVVRVLRDNPAEKAGLMAGDVIVSINDEQAGDWTIEQAVEKIRGEVGTTVKLAVVRGEEAKEFTVTRAEVNNPSVYTTIQDGVGIMTVSRFDDQTGSLARAAAQQFRRENVRAVVLDLRGNGGGYITAAQEVASLWLENQVVVSERTNGRVVDELRTGRNATLKGLPTVVLINQSSASASEIVAGALNDYDVAQLVGEKSFGKGSVQKLIPLTEGAELKVTVARWYTPKGANISEQGITPDRVVPMTADDINAARDPQLDAAKEILR